MTQLQKQGGWGVESQAHQKILEAILKFPKIDPKHVLHLGISADALHTDGQVYNLITDNANETELSLVTLTKAPLTLPDSLAEVGIC